MAKTNVKTKMLAMAYGLGASVVIIGALFKILHFQIGFLTGGVMLTIGLVTEALIFAISAFEPVDEDLDWSKVYPELAQEDEVEQRRERKQEIQEAEVGLSEKLDQMLQEAKIDGNLMESLGESIRNFEGAAKNMAPTAEAMGSQKKYSEEMSLAASQMESLNSLYKVQVESSSKQAEANEAIAENAQQLKSQMESLTNNLSNLNGVYGNMLTAMQPKA